MKQKQRPRPRKRRQKLIAPVEEIILLKKGKITQTEGKVSRRYPYKFEAHFPDFKMVFTIDEIKGSTKLMGTSPSKHRLILIETGHNSIIHKLHGLNYKIPKYLEKYAKEMERLWSTLNGYCYKRLVAGKLDDEEIQEEWKKAQDTKQNFWLYYATDEEIVTACKDVFYESNVTQLVKQDVSIKFFLHFRHAAIDAIAAQKRQGIKEV